MVSKSTAKIAVLMGGVSSEREVSLVSGKCCAESLERLGHEVHAIDVGRDLGSVLWELKPDLAFNALHGPYGEDGTVQGLLELMEIPYTHSGVLSSSLAMDKQKTKLAYRDADLPVAPSIVAPKAEVQAKHLMEPPYVIKPYNEGSSVGVYIVEQGANTPPELAANMPDLLMVEKYLKGRELTVGVLGGEALCVTDIITDGWYDFDAKYADGGSRHELPAKLPNEITEACLRYAERAHEALGCRGMTRTDFRYDESQGLAGLFLLETNTQPGMTPTSLAPEQAQFQGMSFDDLIDWLIKDASCMR